MDIRKDIFKASVKLHVLMRVDEQVDYPYAYPFDDVVHTLARVAGIDDEELDDIQMEAVDLAHEIVHILEV